MYKTVERLGDNDSNSFFNAEQYIYESSMILQPDTYVTLILIINDMMIRDYDNKYFYYKFILVIADDSITILRVQRKRNSF